MKVVTMHTPGSTLQTLEVREDLSMIERRSATMSTGLSLAVASAGAEILLTGHKDLHDPATILLSSIPSDVGVGDLLAIGTSRVEITEIDHEGIWVRPTIPGVIQPGDVLRYVPADLLEEKGAFPRVPDGLPDAFEGENGRFTPSYESRAKEVWNAMTQLGFHPTFDWAGSEDGEAVVARDVEGHAQLIVDLEEPGQQELIDRKLAEGSLAQWICEEISSLPRGL